MQENPITSENDLIKLKDPKFIESLSKNDFWYQNLELPDQTFPYSDIWLNGSFYRQLIKSIQGTNREMKIFTHRRKDLWENENVTGVQDFILKEFQKLVVEKGMFPILVHLPMYGEVDDYQKSGKLPKSIKHTEDFCYSHGLQCFFPLRDSSDFKSMRLEELYLPEGHYSSKGNKAVARFLKKRIQELGRLSI